MIARPVYTKQRGGGGMTLPEIMIALAILGVVLSVCYGSSVALQRGFASTAYWTDARINQLRVLDSLAADLRNATAKSFTISADGLTNTLPLTLTIPMRYQPNPSSSTPPPSPTPTPTPTAYETTGPLAGDPARSALRIEPGIYPTTGSIQYRDSSGQQVAIAVTYRYGGSGTKRTIVRQIDWPYTAPVTSTLALSPPLSAAANTASREVGSFTNYSSASLADPNNILKVTFTNKDMQLISSSDTAVVVRIEASPDSLHLENKSVLNDTVFLREATFK
jgi:prepilin-type N-terminal cleavage/methylation domain-containing protein